jgi:hypothetical protein
MSFTSIIGSEILEKVKAHDKFNSGVIRRAMFEAIVAKYKLSAGATNELYKYVRETRDSMIDYTALSNYVSMILQQETAESAKVVQEHGGLSRPVIVSAATVTSSNAPYSEETPLPKINANTDRKYANWQGELDRNAKVGPYNSAIIGNVDMLRSKPDLVSRTKMHEDKGVYYNESGASKLIYGGEVEASNVIPELSGLSMRRNKAGTGDKSAMLSSSQVSTLLSVDANKSSSTTASTDRHISPQKMMVQSLSDTLTNPIAAKKTYRASDDDATFVQAHGRGAYYAPHIDPNYKSHG